MIEIERWWRGREGKKDREREMVKGKRKGERWWRVKKDREGEIVEGEREGER